MPIVKRLRIEPENRLIDRETSDRRAAAWGLRWPRMIMRCQTCGGSWPLVIDGKADAWCPRCDSADKVIAEYEGPTAEELFEAAAGKERADEIAEDEPDPDEGRCDPPGLDDVIGNAAAVRWLKTVLRAFRLDIAALDERTKAAKRLPFPHALLSGSGGTGKTMLSEIIAREIDRPIRLQMGQTLTSPARVGDVLLALNPGDVLFIDELHGMKVPCQETLYRAMEDRVYVPVQRAGAPVTEPIRLPPFTLIGSTTDEWALMPSMLQRFKVRLRLQRLSADELARAMLDRAARKDLTLTEEAAAMIGARSHGTPRLAIVLLDGCVATGKANGETAIDHAVVEMTCELLEIDGLGLDFIGRKYMEFLADGNGKPVRLNVLATRLDGLSKLTVERRVEPDLLFLGLIGKGPNGRELTTAGREYLQNLNPQT